MADLTPVEVPTLIPGAPQPEPAHLALARGWLTGELAVRGVVLAGLAGDALLLARTAWAAKALAFKAGISGTVSLGGTEGGGGLKGIELPGLKLTLSPTSTDTRGNAVVAAADWEALAARLLGLALVGSTQQPQRRFFGAAR